MRYVIVGCGRVGSALAKLLDSDGHEVIVVDENAAAFKRLGPEIQRTRSRRHRHRLRRPQARRRGDRRWLRRRHQRRQSQHHGRADRAAHVQDQAHRRPHLRSAARADVPRARHSDRLPDDGRRKDDSRRLSSRRRGRSQIIRLRQAHVARRQSSGRAMPASASARSRNADACASRPSVAARTK